MATGAEGGAYNNIGKIYQEEFAKSGITLEIRASAGSIDNVRLLNDPKSGVQAALLQGGITNSEINNGIVSIGRVMPEPVWVFYRLPAPIDRLTALRGKRIVVGGIGSGTFVLAAKLLAANGVNPSNTKFLTMGSAAGAAALKNGEADAGFFVLGPSSSVLKDMLADPNLSLMSFTQAEAYTRRFPFLQHFVYPEGTSDLGTDRPPADVQLIAPIAAVVARRDLHPTLVNLLAQVLKTVHTPAGMFQKTGEFPQSSDPEFEVAEDAQNFYQNGPPFWQRFLPFWLASFVNRMQVMVLPLLAVVLPVLNLVPKFFEWRLRARILHWYGKLRRLERIVAADPEAGSRVEVKMEINRIDAGVKALPIPVRYAGELYDLRGHVDFVRQLITGEVAAAAAAESGVDGPTTSTAGREQGTIQPAVEGSARNEPSAAASSFSPYAAWVSATTEPVTV